AGGIDAELAEGGDLHPIVWGRGDEPSVARPDDASQLRAVIAQAEVPMPISMRLEVADLAPYPQRHEGTFEDVPRCLRHRPDAHGRHWRRARKGVAKLVVRCCQLSHRRANTARGGPRIDGRRAKEIEVGPWCGCCARLARQWALAHRPLSR